MVHSFLQWFECHFLSYTHITSAWLFPVSLPPCNLEHLLYYPNMRPSLSPNSYIAGGIGEWCFRPGPGSRVRGWTGCRVAAAFGEQIWLMQWLEHSWAAPSKHKNKQGSDSTEAGCLAFIPWAAALGWWLLCSGYCFHMLAWCLLADELYPDHSGLRVTRTSRLNAYLQLISEDTPRFRCPLRLWSPSFPIPLFLHQGAFACPSFGHPSRWTNSSLFWDTGGVTSLLRVSILQVWI